MEELFFEIMVQMVGAIFILIALFIVFVFNSAMKYGVMKFGFKGPKKIFLNTLLITSITTLPLYFLILVAYDSIKPLLVVFYQLIMLKPEEAMYRQCYEEVPSKRIQIVCLLSNVIALFCNMLFYFAVTAEVW